MILGVSIWANLDGNFQSTLQKQIDEEGLNIPLVKYQTAIWVMAGAGGFLFLTGFLGCCGAACENRVLLGLFFVIVLILYLLELGAGIAVLVMKDKFKEDITKAIQELADKDGGKPLQPIQDQVRRRIPISPLLIIYSFVMLCSSTAAVPMVMYRLEAVVRLEPKG